MSEELLIQTGSDFEHRTETVRFVPTDTPRYDSKNVKIIPGEVVEDVQVPGIHTSVPGSSFKLDENGYPCTVVRTVYTSRCPSNTVIDIDNDRKILRYCAWCTLGIEPPIPDGYDAQATHGGGPSHTEAWRKEIDRRRSLKSIA